MEPIKPILCGPPARKAKQLELNIAKYVPALGSVKVPCDKCGEIIWLGLHQQDMHKKGAEVMCLPCLRPLMKDAEIQRAGGIGGSFTTTGGQTFGPRIEDRN